MGTEQNRRTANRGEDSRALWVNATADQQWVKGLGGCRGHRASSLCLPPSVACMLPVFRLQFHHPQPISPVFCVDHACLPASWANTRSCSHPQEAVSFLSFYVVLLKTLNSFTTGSKPVFRGITTIHSLSCGNTSFGGFPD